MKHVQTWGAVSEANAMENGSLDEILSSTDLGHRLLSFRGLAAYAYFSVS